MREVSLSALVDAKLLNQLITFNPVDIISLSKVEAATQQHSHRSSRTNHVPSSKVQATVTDAKTIEMNRNQLSKEQRILLTW